MDVLLHFKKANKVDLYQIQNYLVVSLCAKLVHLLSSTGHHRILRFSYNIVDLDIVKFSTNDFIYLVGFTSLGQIFAVKIKLLSNNTEGKTEPVTVINDSSIIFTTNQEPKLNNSAIYVVDSQIFLLNYSSTSLLLTILHFKIVEDEISAEFRFSIPVKTEAFQPRKFDNLIGRKLYCILSESSYKERLQASKCCDKYISISDHLYNCVFGQDLNLLNSKILLIVLPGGIVRWMPMKTLDGATKETQILCTLDEDVVNIFELRSSNSKDATRSGFMLVGCRGTILVTSCRRQGKIWVPCFERYHSPGPVSCCDVQGKFLIYSTGHSLCCVDLDCVVAAVSIGDPVSSISSLCQYNSLKSVSIANVCHITAISACKKETEDKITLYACISSDRIVKLVIDIPTNQPEVHELSEICTSGQSVNDLLTSIGRLWEEYKALTISCQSHNELLRQLAFAGTLQTYFHKARSKESTNPDISMKCSTVSATAAPVKCSLQFVLLQNGFNMEVSFHNDSHMSFNRFWRFLVIVSNQIDFSVDLKLELDSLHLSKSCCLDGVKPNQATSVAFHFDSYQPFIVTPLLICDLSTSTIGRNFEPIIVALKSEFVGVSRLMKPHSIENHQYIGMDSVDLSLALDDINSIRRPALKQTRNEVIDDVSDKAEQSYSVKISIPFSNLIECDAQKIDMPTKQDVVRWIFKTNPLFANAQNKLPITVRFFYGHSAVIDVSSVSTSDNLFHITLSSSSLFLLVLLKLEISQNSKGRILDTSRDNVDTSRLRKLLEELGDEIGSGYDVIKRTNDCNSVSKLCSRIFQLYQLLRTVTL